MGAHYDNYDYPNYWVGREYEHLAELAAVRAFLKSIPQIKTILDIGAGFGRLTPSYSYRAKKVILSDPSSKLLALARQKYKQRKFQFVHSKLDNIHQKIKPKSVDLVVCVRVIHHIEDVEGAIENICNLLKKKGYLILEFANKKHFKALLSQFLKGNLTFPLDIFPADRRSKKNLTRTLPFLNYHPEIIKRKLTECDFEILETRSVSNIRSSIFKKILPLDTLIFIEKYLQKPLGIVNFGPSIFVLAQKRA